MAPKIIHLNPGQRVKRWLILQKIGQGAFGTVYKCSNHSGQYALKVEGTNLNVQVIISFYY